MPSVGALLVAIGEERLRSLTIAGLDRNVRRIALLESLRDVDLAPADALVLLTRAASAESASYRFDVALRRGADRRVAAIALAGVPADVLSHSALAVAERTHVAILEVGGDVDIAELSASIGGLLRGDATAALELASAGVRALDRARASGAGVDATLTAVSEALPGAGLGERRPGTLHEPIVVDGMIESWLVSADGGAIHSLLLRAGAADVAAAMGRIRREQDAPIRSRSELLTELLATEPGRDGSLLRRARAIGLEVDAWHAVELVGFEEDDPEDQIYAEELRRAVERVALATARSVSGTWHVARSEGRVVLLRTSRVEPGPRGAATALAAARSILTALEERFPGIRPRVGIGGDHLGPAGLRASAAEARAALATTHPGAAPAVFDASGLRAMLAEWYATDSARRSASALLEPLDRLGGRRAEEAIRTLQAFLEEQGSITRTARRLHLHRNAVSYRMGRIRDALQVEPDDPDTRLALQLACRARLLG